MAFKDEMLSFFPFKINYSFFIVVITIKVLFYSSFVYAKNSPIVGIIYPEIREPYASVFNSIVDGIKESSQYSIKKLKVNKDYNTSKIQKWAAKNNINLIVALGNQGITASDKVAENIDRVVGAILKPPNENHRYISGITLSPSPKLLFERLVKLSPETKKVIVLYNKEYNRWLIDFAQEAANDIGLELNPIEVNDLRAAANIYKEIVDGDITKKTAIWLLQDKYSVDKRTILPMLLKVSWSKKFIVFSSNPAHVKKGVLFSMYPDNVSMGKSIGKIANKILNKEIFVKEATPLKSLYIAINKRTANRLNIEISKDEMKKFELVFPASN